MPDENKPTDGPQVKAIFELSAGLRTTALVLCVIVLFTWIILYVYQPAVSNEDLFNATFTSSVANRLVEENGSAISKTFTDHVDSFDAPYDSIARSYVREPNATLKASALLTFVNTKSQSQRQYLLLLVEDRGVRHTVNEYLVADKSRWQTMPLPILGLQISKNDAILYLCIAFAAVHFYFVAKHRYVLEIRRTIHNLNFIPDPSLISATPTDLAVLGRTLRILVFCGQETLLWVLPLVMCALLGVRFYQSGLAGDADSFGIVRPIPGLLVCAVEALATIVTQISYLPRKRELWRTLFNRA